TVIGLLVQGAGSTGSFTVTVTDSFAANAPAAVGFFAQSDAGQAPVTLTLVRSLAANNDVGLRAFGASATLRIARSVITRNRVGWETQSSGATVSSYGDHHIDGNGDGDPAPPTIVRK